MWIYCIQNVLDGKCYIGQTASKKADHRLKIHYKKLRRGTHGNVYLQRAWNKYGEHSFISWVVCDATDADELDLLEYICIEAQKPNVYNMIDGGQQNKDTCGQRAKIRWSKPGSKRWRHKMNKKIWSDEETRKKMLSGLLKYATNSDLKSKQGKLNWKNPEYRKKVIQSVSKAWSNEELVAKRAKHYGWVADPTGQIHEVFNLRKFCREHQLDHANMMKVVNGKYSQYRGWRKHDPDRTS
jgi:group I intron endonuclease